MINSDYWERERSKERGDYTLPEKKIEDKIEDESDKEFEDPINPERPLREGEVHKYPELTEEKSDIKFLEEKAESVGFSKFRKWAKENYGVTGRSVDGLIQDILDVQSGKKESEF